MGVGSRRYLKHDAVGPHFVAGGRTLLSRILLLHDFRYDLPLQPRLDEKGRTQMVSFKGAHFPKDIILMGIRWYVAYPLSYRHVEELMEERGPSERPVS